MVGTRVVVQPSGEEHHGQPQGGTEEDAGNRVSRRPTYADARSFLREVEETFRDQPEKYHMFMEILLDFIRQRIDTESVMTRAKELFRGYNRLIHGFNTFLPEGYKIVPDEPRMLNEFDEAIGFVIKVKDCFRSEENVYHSFLDAIKRCQLGNNGARAVYNEVASLFAGHPDLLQEFKKFMPKGFQDQEELSSITTLTSRQLEMDRPRQARIAQTQAEDDELTVDFPALDDNEEIMKVQREEMKRFEGHILWKISALYSVLAVVGFLLALWI